MRGSGLGNVRRLLLTGAIRGQPSRFQCTSSTNNNSNTRKDISVEGGKEASIRDFDAYRQVDNLDFMTAAKILFTTPLKKKKFGIDFHLVQLFFVCMPSLAVYLVAQYARYEIKRMEAEAEVKKKKAEEEEKAKEMEKLAQEEQRRRSDPEFLQVKVRLEALEEAVKGIVVETKKPAGSSSTKDQESTQKEEHNTAETKSASKSEDNSTAVAEHHPSLNSQSSKPDPIKGGPECGQGKGYLAQPICTRSLLGRKMHRTCTWQRPNTDEVTLNTDGSISHNSYVYASILKQKGRCSLMHRNKIGNPIVLEQELRPMDTGLEACVTGKFTNVGVASDSPRAVNSLTE